MIFRIILLVTVANICLGDQENGFMDLSYLSRKLSIDETAYQTESPLPEQLRIMDSMRFSCSGEIIGFYLSAAIKSTQLGEYPRAIVFRRRSDDRRRRSDSDDGISYIRRGSVELRPTLSELEPASGVYKYLIPSDPLEFFSGDRFGIYQPPPSNSHVILHYTNLSQSFETTAYVRTAIDTSSQISQHNLQQIRDEYLLITPIFSSGSSCLSQSLNENILRDLSPQIGKLKTQTASELRLFPEINFKNDSYITSWTVGGIVSDNILTPQKAEIQIWRSGANDIVLSSVYQLNTPIETNQNNLYVFEVHPPIPVKAGDILGVFQPTSSTFKLYYQEHNGPQNIVINLQETPQAPTQLQLAVITAFSNINDYPLITVNLTDERPPSQYTVMSTIHSSTTLQTSSSNVQVRVSSLVASGQHTMTDADQQPQPTVVRSTVLSTLNTGTPSPSQQPPSVLAAASNDALLISVISVGAVIIIVTIPALILTLIAALYTYRKSSGKKKAATAEDYSSPSHVSFPVPQNNASLASNNTSSTFTDSISSPSNITSSLNPASTPSIPDINNSLSSKHSYDTPLSSVFTESSSFAVPQQPVPPTPAQDDEDNRDSMQMNPLYYYNVNRMKRNSPSEAKYVNVTETPAVTTPKKNEPIYEEI